MSALVKSAAQSLLSRFGNVDAIDTETDTGLETLIAFEREAWRLADSLAGERTVNYTEIMSEYRKVQA